MAAGAKLISKVLFQIALLLIVVAVVYWVEPAKSLPSFQ